MPGPQLGTRRHVMKGLVCGFLQFAGFDHAEEFLVGDRNKVFGFASGTE